MKRKIIIGIFTLIVLGIVVALPMLSNGTIGGRVVFISGTEYQWGEVGQVIVRTVNTYGMPINADWCRVTVYYPNKTVWINNQLMTQGGAPGSWYYEFTTPFDQIGVYEEYVVCQVTGYPYGTRQIGAGSSFHVSQTLSTLNETLSAQVIIIS